MKQIFLCGLIIILCVVISSCNSCPTTTTSNNNSSSKENQEMNNEFKLYVNGSDISSENYVFINCQEKYAKLPLISIIRSLGCEVKWYNNNKVTIGLGDDIYTLNPTKKTLKKKGDNFNIIALPPGTNHKGYYQIYKNEFIIDSDSMRYFINLLGAKIDIDYNAGIINIANKNTGDGSVRQGDGSIVPKNKTE